ncbi:uncharacterized protein LOC135496038 isoform X2 [Lineus longissimus]|uniref:uncharacterized protein LOC135496038 isoform X2 n=1 Tax=Lineus longissimus TaxID=88925 RepID=UPI002B4EDEFC
MKSIWVVFLLLCVFCDKNRGQRTITCDTSNPVDYAVDLPRAEIGFIIPLIQPPSYGSDHAKCDITLVAASTSLIKITFSLFNESVCHPAKFDYLITGDDCDTLKRCDYLLIHEPYETSRPLKKYDGLHSGDTYKSHSHKVHIRFCFIKPYRDMMTRWKLKYQVKERKGVELFEGTSGTVRTPFFPYGYSIGRDYKWLFVHAEIQGFVFLQFDDMLLARGHTLEIYDGGGPWANREVRNLTDRRPFFSTGPMVFAALMLRDVTNTQVGAGFKLRYDLIQYKRYLSQYKTRTEVLANNSAIFPDLEPRPYTGLLSLFVNVPGSLYYDYLWIIPPLRSPEAAVVWLVNYSFPVGCELQVRGGYHSDANILYKYVSSSDTPRMVNITNKGLYLRLTGFIYKTVYVCISYAIFRDLKQDQYNSDVRQGCSFPGDVNNSVPAMPGFVCHLSRWCIPDFLKCDKILHCAGKEDELKEMCDKKDHAPSTTTRPYRFTTQDPCNSRSSTCVTSTTSTGKDEGGHYYLTWLFISLPILLVVCISFCMVWVIRKSRNRHRNNSPPDYQEHISSTISHTVSFTRTLQQSGNIVNSHSHSDLLGPGHGDIGPFGIINPAMQRSESMDSIFNMPAPPSYSDVIAGNVGTMTRSISQPPPPSYEESEHRETTRRQSLPCPPPYSTLMNRAAEHRQARRERERSAQSDGAVSGNANTVDTDINSNVQTVPPVTLNSSWGANDMSGSEPDSAVPGVGALTPSAPILSDGDTDSNVTQVADLSPAVNNNSMITAFSNPLLGSVEPGTLPLTARDATVIISSIPGDISSGVHISNIVTDVDAQGEHISNVVSDGNSSGATSNMVSDGDAPGVHISNVVTDVNAPGVHTSNMVGDGEAPGVHSSNVVTDGDAPGVHTSNRVSDGEAPGVDSSNVVTDGDAPGVHISNMVTDSDTPGVHISNMVSDGDAGQAPKREQRLSVDSSALFAESQTDLAGENTSKNARETSNLDGRK